jgi:hypothetical protein
MLDGAVVFRLASLLQSVEMVDWIGLRTLVVPTRIGGQPWNIGFRESVKGINA